MNIFVAGVHGVGKTYLAGRLPADSGLSHTSASKLIQEERELPSWNRDKRVTDIDENQAALIAAVARRNTQGAALLLDGHFVLLNQDREFVTLGADVFRSLNLGAVILIEATLEQVAARLNARDGEQTDLEFLRQFIAKERAQAQVICDALNLPLQILVSPSDAVFAKAVHSLQKGRGGSH